MALQRLVLGGSVVAVVFIFFLSVHPPLTPSASLIPLPLGLWFLGKRRCPIVPYPMCARP